MLSFYYLNEELGLFSCGVAETRCTFELPLFDTVIQSCFSLPTVVHNYIAYLNKAKCTGSFLETIVFFYQ